jgi:hypothetical protein
VCRQPETRVYQETTLHAPNTRADSLRHVSAGGLRYTRLTRWHRPIIRHAEMSCRTQHVHVSRPTRLLHAPNTLRSLDTCSAEQASTRVRTRVLGRVDTMESWTRVDTCATRCPKFRDAAAWGALSDDRYKALQRAAHLNQTVGLRPGNRAVKQLADGSIVRIANSTTGRWRVNDSQGWCSQL